jgi:hypothetical protein
VEGQGADAARLGLAEMAAGGEAAVGGQLTRRLAMAVDVALEHRLSLSAGLPASTTRIISG